jgi:hypothetical protein
MRLEETTQCRVPTRPTEEVRFMQREEPLVAAEEAPSAHDDIITDSARAQVT